jgi:hypothetical protein
MNIQINLKRKRVNDVCLGDPLLCYDEFHGNYRFKKVTNLFSPLIRKENQRSLNIDDKVDVRTSSIHPFYDFDNEVWVEARYIDEINGISFKNELTSIKAIESAPRDDEHFFDFTVEDTHNYFVGKNDTFVLTHNSATVNFPIWHQEIEDILVLKNNKGTQDNRIRDLDYCIHISKIFYERYMKNEDITLFSPHDVPDLFDVFGLPEFDELYLKYEKSHNPKTKISARKLFNLLLAERAETGRIYIMNIDHANSHSSWKDRVTMTNLCVSGDSKVKIKHEDNAVEFVNVEDLGLYENIEILSYNEKNKNYEFKKVLNFGMTNKEPEELLHIEDTNTGYELKCTPEHKILTQRGYVMARDLKEDDKIVSLET